jgi:hypothetical protein
MPSSVYRDRTRSSIRYFRPLCRMVAKQWADLFLVPTVRKRQNRFTVFEEVYSRERTHLLDMMPDSCDEFDVFQRG